jgi:hypothetical protein
VPCHASPRSETMPLIVGAANHMLTGKKVMPSMDLDESTRSMGSAALLVGRLRDGRQVRLAVPHHLGMHVPNDPRPIFFCNHIDNSTASPAHRTVVERLSLGIIFI